METALRNRLTFGPIMLAALFGLLALDHFAEQWTVGWVPHRGGPHGIGGIGLGLVLLIVMPPATIEIARLFTAEHVQPYRTISALGSGAMLAHAFFTQFTWFQEIATSTLAFVVAFVMLAAALRRAWAKQTQEAITRMAGTVLSTLYLGGLGWFLLALRVKHGEHFNGSTAVVLMI